MTCPRCAREMTAYVSCPPVRDLDAALREPFGGKRGDREAAELLQRMLDAGLSKYEPDPLAALDQAMRSAP